MPKPSPTQVLPPRPPEIFPKDALMKPSVLEALKASIAQNDPGFTAEDMRKAWGYENVCSALRRIKRLCDEGVYELAGSEEHRDSLGRPYRRPTFRVVKGKKDIKHSRKK